MAAPPPTRKLTSRGPGHQDRARLRSAPGSPGVTTPGGLGALGAHLHGLYSPMIEFHSFTNTGWLAT